MYNYSNKNTISSLEGLIILENFLCINRSFLLENSRTRFYGNSFFNFMLVTIFGVSIYDFVYNGSEIRASILSFQVFIGFEVFYLAVTARERNSFVALKRLDGKCGVDEEYLKDMRVSVKKTVVIAVLSSVLDAVGGFILIPRASVVLTFCVATAAHDAEMAFYSLLFEGMNWRLSKMEHLPLSLGWKLYRHVLITALNLSEEFTARVCMI